MKKLYFTKWVYSVNHVQVLGCPILEWTWVHSATGGHERNAYYFTQTQIQKLAQVLNVLNMVTSWHKLCPPDTQPFLVGKNADSGALKFTTPVLYLFSYTTVQPSRQIIRDTRKVWHFNKSNDNDLCVGYIKINLESLNWMFVLITLCLSPVWLKTLDNIGNCQRPVFLLGVSQHMHKITNLWKFELNWSSKLRDNNER